MSDRPKPFDDEQQAELIEKSQRLIAEMEKLIERAKALQKEHRVVTDALKDLRKNRTGK